VFIKLKKSFNQLISFFEKKEKIKLLGLFFMMIVAALFETLGIGLIVSIIGLILNPKSILKHKTLANLYHVLHFQSPNYFIVASVILLILIFVLKNLYLLLFNFTQLKIILNQQFKLSRKLYKSYLTKPYLFHLQRNTAQLLRNINGGVSTVFNGVVISSFQLMTELLVSAFILIMLLFTAPVATIIASLLLGLSVFIFFKVFKQKITEMGKEQQNVLGLLIKWVNQGLGASKEVKVSGKEAFFIEAYSKQSEINIKNSRYMGMLDQAPRLFIETILVSVILITMLVIVFQGKNTTNFVSTMSLFAMAAFRIMPSITRVISLITTIRYSQPALSNIYNDMKNFQDEEVENDSNNKQKLEIALGQRAFRDCIEVSNVSFRYPNQEDYTIKDVSLTIPIGKSVAFIGESGAGKTTLIDILLGLFLPDKGNVLIDHHYLNNQKVLWQKKIGYIPQSIYLSDDTIRNNVAFGLERNDIDDNEIWRALEQANLKKFVETLPDQLDTVVGERGVRLSGGQRQRIGIARALYNNPEILFMDEATSALDNETEKEIMKAIDGLKGEKTLIIIAHRLTTIENCDIVFKLNKGRLVSVEEKLKKSII
jgi:ATP-binding cassette, subfamily B, bacterial PglK